VFLTNLEGKVGKVGKVVKVGKVGRVGKVSKVGKEGRLREKQLPILYQILQHSNKNGEKIYEQFCCENLEKAYFGYRYLNSYKLSVFFFEPNKVLT
jgi:hypothetical protein